MLKKRCIGVLACAVALGFTGPALAAGQLRLGVVAILENEDLLTMRDAFVGQMEQQGYAVKMAYFNADSLQYPDTFVERATDAVQKMKQDGVDMFLTLGMYPRVVAALGDTPTLDPSHVPVPQTASVYRWENGNTYCYGNATGTMLAYPFAAVVDFVKAAAPRAKKIGYIYNPDSPQSRPVEELESVAGKAGLQVVPCPFSDYKTGMEAVQKAIDASDIAFGTNDIYIAGIHEAGIQLGNENKFPIVVGIVPLVHAGAVAGMQLDWARAAQLSAQKADLVLKGKKANEIPIGVSDQYQIGLNLKSAESMGLEIPYEWIKTATVVVE